MHLRERLPRARQMSVESSAYPPAIIYSIRVYYACNTTINYAKTCQLSRNKPSFHHPVQESLASYWFSP